MLPQTTQADITQLVQSSRIYINPNFKVRQDSHETHPHINPLFLRRGGTNTKPPKIHMNPKFLEQKIIEQELKQVRQQEIIFNKAAKPIIDQKLISKSRTKIVREPLSKYNTTPVLQPLLSLTKRKLVRRAASVPSTTPRIQRSINRVISGAKKYKVDNRLKGYALRRVVRSKNNVVASTSNANTFNNPLTVLRNKKLQLLNINGVLYKSSCNKLQREDVPNSKSKTLVPLGLKMKSTLNPMVQKRSASGRTLYVRGAKFVMDAQGFKLTRVAPVRNASSSDKSLHNTLQPYKQRKRIDIGGLTYIASKTQNVFVRTRNHLTKAHLNTAKQRSLQLLSRCLRKSNVPCAIFQRLGKCKAFERGKCSKAHDKQQISICPRFLRGECHSTQCLLSHNISLTKMPVCKFFLQGVCVRSDCPYLHKKLSQQTEICVDFLRGFCGLAEQCRKRHEFLCPRYERNGKCELANCEQCEHKKRCEKNKPMRSNPPTTAANDEAEVPTQNESDENVAARYFIASTDGDKDSDCVSEPVKFKARPKVGALPAFIPL